MPIDTGLIRGGASPRTVARSPRPEPVRSRRRLPVAASSGEASAKVAQSVMVITGSGGR